MSVFLIIIEKIANLYLSVLLPEKQTQIKECKIIFLIYIHITGIAQIIYTLPS